MKLQPGTQIGEGLRLRRPLGSGASSSVWQARDGDGELVAIKFFARELTRDKTARARFRREAKLAQQLRSPHIVRSFGHGIADDGTPYIVMELLRGETLDDRLRRERVLAASQLLAILRQIAIALEVAHKEGIVHRDVKPSNIFLVDATGDLLVKVLDFGMAKRTEVPNPSVVTEMDVALGTPDYMSPEAIRSARKIDPRSDQWALGVMAYRALLGRLPFVAESFPALCMAICTGRFTPATELAPNLPAAVDEWFDRVLSVERSDRYRSVGKAVDALEQALSTEDAAPATSGAPPQGAHRGLDLVIAVLIAIAAFCGGALIASIDKF